MIASPRDLPTPPPFAEPFAPSRSFIPDCGVLEALSRFADSKVARKNLEALAAGRAQVVVTGQQPSFPQPLGLTLQKTATAIALARREVDHVPVFWNGSDDSNFEEAAGQLLPRQGKTALKVSLPGRLNRKGRRVGDLPLDAAYAELLDFAMPPFLPREGENLGDFHARVLSELFASEGLLVLDARSPAIMDSARPMLLRYAESREEITRIVDGSGDALEAKLGKRPLRRGIGERALFFLKDGRRRLPTLEKYEEALRGRLEDPGGRLSPNVVMRPLVQDFVLPVIGTVLGPSEWIYHHQIRPVFEILGQVFPRPWPRLDTAGVWELRRVSPPAGGRHHSPLMESDNRLAQPESLLALAELHLEDWKDKHYHQWIIEGEEI